MSEDNQSETLESRVGKIEKLINGSDDLWSIAEIQGILNKTDLKPEMEDMELCGLDKKVNLNEGCISILQQSHLSHTNTDLIEFKNMHGFNPEPDVDETLPNGLSEEKGIAVIFYGFWMLVLGGIGTTLSSAPIASGITWGILLAISLFFPYFFLKIAEVSRQ